MKYLCVGEKHDFHGEIKSSKKMKVIEKGDYVDLRRELQSG
jgi:hypothetical protein